jgi:hypothetical protein
VPPCARAARENGPSERAARSRWCVPGPEGACRLVRCDRPPPKAPTTCSQTTSLAGAAARRDRGGPRTRRRARADDADLRASRGVREAPWASRPTWWSRRRCTRSRTAAALAGAAAGVHRGRPAGVHRARHAHLASPVKLWSAGPAFRAENVQRGRYRQFHQVNSRSSAWTRRWWTPRRSPCWSTCSGPWGCAARDRQGRLRRRSWRIAQRYNAYLREALGPTRRELSEVSRERLRLNPMRVLDSKDERDQALLAPLRRPLDMLGDAARAHLDAVTATSTPGGPVRARPGHRPRPRLLPPHGLRGPPRGIGAQSALGGGGRYDGLLRQLGGPDLPGIGWALGIERLFDAMDGEGVAPPSVSGRWRTWYRWTTRPSRRWRAWPARCAGSSASSTATSGAPRGRACATPTAPARLRRPAGLAGARSRRGHAQAPRERRAARGARGATGAASAGRRTKRRRHDTRPRRHLGVAPTA